MSNLNLLTAAETAALLSVTHAATEQVEIARGTSLPVSGASASEWIAEIVRPCPNVRKTFTMGASEEIALQQGIERERKFDLAKFLDDNIQEGPETKARMGALFLRQPGDPEVMQAFMRMPSDAQRRILSTGGRLTWGSDPGNFFAKVGRELAGLDAVLADSLEDQEAPPAKKKPAAKRAA